MSKGPPPPPAADQGRICFYRLARLWRAGLNAWLRLDGERIGRPVAGRFLCQDVAPGTHEITIRTEVRRRLVLTVAPGETRYVRVTAGFGWLIGRFRLEPVAAETAEAEMRELMPAGDRA